MWLWVLMGCNLLRSLQGADAYDDPCEQRSAFWADTDANGFGDTGSVYIGCESPEGYVSVPPPEDTDETSETDETDS